MTVFEYHPVRKIIIHQMNRSKLESFRERLLRVPGYNHAKWIGGILFVHFAVHETPEVVEEELAGTLHWSVLEFAKCDAIPESIKDHYKEIAIFDCTGNPIFEDFARWLKTQPIWEGKD